MFSNKYIKYIKYNFCDFPAPLILNKPMKNIELLTIFL